MRDVKDIEYADLRIVKSGEGCPISDGTLEVFSAIELGHILSLEQSILKRWVLCSWM